MKCKKCGGELLADDKFCPFCGIEIEKSSKRICHKCNAIVNEKALFCGECGTKLDSKEISIKSEPVNNQSVSRSILALISGVITILSTLAATLFGLYAFDFYNGNLASARSSMSSYGGLIGVLQDRIMEFAQTIVDTFLYSSLLLVVSLILVVIGIYWIYKSDKRAFLPFIIAAIFDLISGAYVYFSVEQHLRRLAALTNSPLYGFSDFSVLMFLAIIAAVFTFISAVICFVKIRKK